MNRSSALEYLTIEKLCFLLAALVVLLHCYNLYDYGSGAITFDRSLYDFVRIFFTQGVCRVAVPTFFLMSGYLFFKNLEYWNNQEYVKKMKSRFWTLFIPYLLWNLIAFCFLFIIDVVSSLSQIHSLYDFIDRFNSFGSMHGWLRIFWDDNYLYNEGVTNVLGYEVYGAGPINLPFWFIRDLMIVSLLSRIIYYFIVRIGKTYLLILGLLMVFNIWPQFAICSSTSIFFFSLGGFIRLRGYGLLNFCYSKKYLFLVFSAILLILMVLSFGKAPLVYEIEKRLFTISGALVTIWLVSLSVRKVHDVDISLYSKSSFFIYAIHYTILIPIVYAAVKRVLPFDNQITLILKYISSAIIITYLGVAIYKIIFENTKKTFLGLLVGKRK